MKKELCESIMQRVAPIISDILNESDNGEGSRFTDNELLQDYKDVDYADIKTKKEYAAKYGIESKKIADIRKAIAIELRKNRHMKTEFTDEDVSNYRKLEPPDMYKKLKLFLDDEPRAFVEYLRDYYFGKLRQCKLDRYAKPGITLSSYSFSAADRYRINLYRNVLQYLNENSDSYRQECDYIAVLEKMLVENSVDFRNYILETAEDCARKEHKNAPANLEASRAKRVELSKRLETLHWRDSEYHTVSNAITKVSTNIANLKMIMAMTEQEYVAQQRDEADRYYKDTMHQLAERLKEHNIDVPNAVVSEISFDPKLFELHISDGKQNLYARSIIAAVNSMYKCMHYRFIITNERRK